MKDVEGDVVLYKPTVTSWQVVSTEQLPNTSTAFTKLSGLTPSQLPGTNHPFITDEMGAGITELQELKQAPCSVPDMLVKSYLLFSFLVKMGLIKEINPCLSPLGMKQG